MQTFKRYLVTIIGFIIVGIAAAFTIKANIGIGAYDAVAKSISDITDIQVGTMTIVINTSCVVGQIIVLKKDFKLINLLQVPLSVLLGVVINFVYYNLLTFTFDSYILGIVMYTLASLVCAFGVSVVMAVNEVTLALEGFCLALSGLVHIDFAKLRQYADFLSIIIVIVLTLIFKIPFNIGLGTIIGAIIFGPAIGIYMKILVPLFKKAGI